jgi:hypothetical protein
VAVHLVFLPASTAVFTQSPELNLSNRLGELIYNLPVLPPTIKSQGARRRGTRYTASAED